MSRRTKLFLCCTLGALALLDAEAATAEEKGRTLDVEAGVLSPERYRQPVVREVTLTNDFFTFNSIDDDLFTSAAEIVLGFQGVELSLKEVSFTDSENGLRFDESHISVGKELHVLGNWYTSFRVGAVYVGEGLLGESAQNTVHRAIDDTEVHIPYIDSTDYHPTAALRLAGLYRLRRDLTATPELSVFAAPGLRSHAQASATLRWQPLSKLVVRLGAGVRNSSATFDPIEPWIHDLAATWQFGLSLPYGLDFSLVSNGYGTERQHFLVSYNLATLPPRSTR